MKFFLQIIVLNSFVFPWCCSPFLTYIFFCAHFLNISELQSFRSVGSFSCLCIFSHYWSLLVLPCNALITSVDYPWSEQGLVRKSSQGISGLLWNTTLIWKCYTATICSLQTCWLTGYPELIPTYSRQEYIKCPFFSWLSWPLHSVGGFELWYWPRSTRIKVICKSWVYFAPCVLLVWSLEWRRRAPSVHIQTFPQRRLAPLWELGS